MNLTVCQSLIKKCTNLTCQNMVCMEGKLTFNLLSKYNVKIFIYKDNNPKPYKIGPSNSKNGVSTVLLSGVVDADHYDVINCSNSHFWENYKKQYNHDYHDKHKDSINVKKQVKNLTESMLFNKRNLDKIVHMSEDHINKKRNKDLIGNMTIECVIKKKRKM